MRSLVISLSLSVATLCYLPIAVAVTTDAMAPLKPVVFYHGMGDSAHSKGMLELFDSVKEVAPEIFIHSIFLAESEAEDQRAGFFGNVNKQIESVCQQLKSIPELEDGFNAVGFSQGGQFLRAYVQRCNDPPVHNLVTVGSQHSGVSDIPGCVQSDPSCRLMRSIAKSGVYSGYVRDHVVQAQYYKDPNNLQTYLERNIFLPDINNEREVKNAMYKKRLTSINNLVMFMFTEDITVRPKETAWFGFSDETGDIVDLEEQDQYKEDWLGLRTMDEAGKLVFDIMEGEHVRTMFIYTAS
ncbi:palmitoyl-protein thioesterase [Dissophora ornata]|nr:palmitoyl-protein thioesterase [Dissophora ornata]